VPAPAAKPVSSVPSVFKRAIPPRGTALYLVKPPPMSALPPGCIAMAQT
jgi:hypothetical protein